MILEYMPRVWNCILRMPGLNCGHCSREWSQGLEVSGLLEWGQTCWVLDRVDARLR